MSGNQSSDAAPRIAHHGVTVPFCIVRVVSCGIAPDDYKGVPGKHAFSFIIIERMNAKISQIGESDRSLLAAISATPTFRVISFNLDPLFPGSRSCRTSGRDS